MHPVAIVHDRPERIAVERAQVGDHRYADILDALVMQRTGQMMMIDDVVPLLWAEHHGDHMLAEKFSALLGRGLTPLFALGHDFAKANGDLSWLQFLTMATAAATGSRTGIMSIWPTR